MIKNMRLSPGGGIARLVISLIVLILIILQIGESNCYADFRLPKNAEVKTVKKYKDTWIKGFASGQPTEGYKLRKGAFLAYSEGGGKKLTASASFSFPYGVGNVSFAASIPIGKGKGGSVSSGLPIPKNGSYKVYMKKKIRLTVNSSYYRENKKSKWKPIPNGVHKIKKIRKIVPELWIRRKDGTFKKIDY